MLKGGVIFVFIALCCISVSAQTTAFSYQGRLNDIGVTANGNYEMEFRLFDAVNGGTQSGAAQPIPNVAVTDGSFAVLLDFGATAFPGANRFLEIRVRTGGNPNVPDCLEPRQQDASHPGLRSEPNPSPLRVVSRTFILFESVEA